MRGLPGDDGLTGYDGSPGTPGSPGNELPPYLLLFCLICGVAYISSKALSPYRHFTHFHSTKYYILFCLFKNILFCHLMQGSQVGMTINGRCLKEDDACRLFSILLTFLPLPRAISLLQELHLSNQLQPSLFEIMLVLLNNSYFECLSLSFSLICN